LRDFLGDVFSGWRLLAAAFPARAPTTPPIAAPTGPATLPIVAPATVPAVCFGIDGTWISLDVSRLPLLFGLGWLVINAPPEYFLDPRYYLTSRSAVDIAVANLKSRAATNAEFAFMFD